MTIFDFIKNLTIEKVPWDSYTESEKKEFNIYMINRWLSMDPDYNLIEIINELQHLTIGLLEPKEVYKLYYYLLPKQQYWLKFIKGKKESKYNPELIEYCKKYFELGEDDILDHLDILYKDLDLVELREILSKFGLSEKEIKKLVSIKRAKEND